MKAQNIDQKLINSRPASYRGNMQFVDKTMHAIAKLHVHENAREEHRKPHTSRAGSIAAWFHDLSFAASVAVVALSVLFTGGVVYASVEYIPRLIEIFSKSETDRGTTEYFVPDYKDVCSIDNLEQTDRFELNRLAAELSDEEARKIIQARCETDQSWGLIDEIWGWPDVMGPPKQGDVLTYRTSEIVGTVIEISDESLKLDISAIGSKEGSPLGVLLNPMSRTYSFAPDEEIVVLQSGLKTSIDQIQVGDTILPIVQYTETYLSDYDPDGKTGSNGTVTYDPPETEREEMGVVGIIKMSLPAKYYHYEQQQNLTNVGSCFGNEGEDCPQVQSQIDVFPRGNGEGSFNPELVQSESSTYRTIVGKVKRLDESSLVIESSGKEYSITTPKSGIRDYNEIYALPYLEQGDDASLRVGSTVEAMYWQSEGSDPRTVLPDQIQRIALLFDGNPKKGSLKQY